MGILLFYYGERERIKNDKKTIIFTMGIFKLSEVTKMTIVFEKPQKFQFNVNFPKTVKLKKWQSEIERDGNLKRIALKKVLSVKCLSLKKPTK